MPRYTMDVDDDFDGVLNGLQTATGKKSKAALIRDAIASYAFLKKEQKEGRGIAITDEANPNRVKKVVQLP